MREQERGKGTSRVVSTQQSGIGVVSCERTPHRTRSGNSRLSVGYRRRTFVLRRAGEQCAATLGTNGGFGSTLNFIALPTSACLMHLQAVCPRSFLELSSRAK